MHDDVIEALASGEPDPDTMKLYEFKFFDGQVFRGRGHSERDALRRLGLGAYNPVAYEVREITDQQ